MCVCASVGGVREREGAGGAAHLSSRGFNEQVIMEVLADTKVITGKDRMSEVRQ